MKSLLTVQLLGCLLLASCSVERPEEARLRLEVAPSEIKSRELARDWMFSSAPASIDEMHCLVLNVIGPGIPDIETGRQTPYNFSQKFPKAIDPNLATNYCEGYPGILSNFVSVRTGGVVEVSVPTGPQRLVQVLGMKTGNLGCPNETYFEVRQRMGKDALKVQIPNIYEVGRAVTNVTGDTTLDIASVYSQASPRDLEACNSNSSFSMPTGLVFHLSADEFVANGSWPTRIPSGGTMPLAGGGANPTLDTSVMNGRKSVYFGSSSNYYSNTGVVTNPLDSITSVTVMTVFKPDVVGTAIHTLLAMRYNSSSDPWPVLKLSYNSSGSPFYSYMAQWDNVAGAYSNSNINASVPSFLVAYKGAGTSIGTAQLNNETSGNSAAANPPASTTLNLIQVGANLIGSEVFRGHIAEVLIFSRALSGGEINSVRCHMNAKYNLGLGGCS